MQRLFLDTTIQIRRLIYAPIIHQTIQKQLQGCEILTSTYVWMEVQRTIGQDFQYLIDLVLRKQPTTLSQLLYDLGEQETIFSSRILGRIVQIVAQVLDEFQSKTFHPVDIAIFLQQHREWMLHHAFLPASIRYWIQPNVILCAPTTRLHQEVVCPAAGQRHVAPSLPC